MLCLELMLMRGSRSRLLLLGWCFVERGWGSGGRRLWRVIRLLRGLLLRFVVSSFLLLLLLLLILLPLRCGFGIWYADFVLGCSKLRRLRSRLLRLWLRLLL